MAYPHQIIFIVKWFIIKNGNMLNIDLLIKNSMKSKNQEELRAYKNLEK